MLLVFIFLVFPTVKYTKYINTQIVIHNPFTFDELMPFDFFEQREREGKKRGREEKEGEKILDKLRFNFNM